MYKSFLSLENSNDGITDGIIEDAIMLRYMIFSIPSSSTLFKLSVRV